MASKMVWLSTLTSIRVCSSVAQAVALGAVGDHVHAMSTDGVQPAAKASHVIRATKSGRKVAVRLAPVLRPCGCGGACMLCDDNGMVQA